MGEGRALVEEDRSLVFKLKGLLIIRKLDSRLPDHPCRVISIKDLDFLAEYSNFIRKH
jgi:hypothetical protein